MAEAPVFESREKTPEKHTCRDCSTPVLAGWKCCRKCASTRTDRRRAGRAAGLKQKRTDDKANTPRVCVESDCDRGLEDRHYNAKLCVPCAEHRATERADAQARARANATAASRRAGSNGKNGASATAKAWSRGHDLPNEAGDTPLSAEDARLLAGMFNSDYSKSDAGTPFSGPDLGGGNGASAMSIQARDSNGSRPLCSSPWPEDPEIEGYFPPPPLSPDRRGVRVIGRRFAAPKEGDHI